MVMMVALLVMFLVSTEDAVSAIPTHPEVFGKFKKKKICFNMLIRYILVNIFIKQYKVLTL